MTAKGSRGDQNKLIRQLIPGGNEVLDLLAETRKLRQRGDNQTLKFYHEKLNEIANIMRDDVLKIQEEA